MSFNVTIYYVDKEPEYLLGVSDIDVLTNGFFRIVDEDQTMLVNPDTVERIVAENYAEE